MSNPFGKGDPGNEAPPVLGLVKVNVPRNNPRKERCHFSDALEGRNLPTVFSASFNMRSDCSSLCNLQGARETNTRKRLRSAPEYASLPCPVRHLEPIIEEFNQRSCRCIVEDTYTKRAPLVVSARRERGLKDSTSPRLLVLLRRERHLGSDWRDGREAWLTEDPIGKEAN
ncbi:hypothetical protein BHM03_00026157 [Ensete ventricosum]|nr:hypothetical protein BHM03_00026157 [Ensete ventricosum]